MWRFARYLPMLWFAGCGRIAFDTVTDAAPSVTTESRLALGFNFTCLLRDNGTVQCWGNGLRGQLGTASTAVIGDNEPASAGPRVGLGATATQIAAGADHACARLVTSSVMCWGVADDSRLGYPGSGDIGDNEQPAAVGAVQVGGLVDEVAAAGIHTCARLGGAVRCWGSGASGRLGYGTTSTIGDDEQPAVAGEVALGATVTQIDARGGHACALLADGSVRCWGNGAQGQLGYASTESIGDNELPAAAGPVDLGAPALQVSTGAAHSCALLVGGRVRCWGLPTSGRLGYGNLVAIGDTETPASAGDVEIGGRAVQITTGAEHTCVLLDTGNIRCWGGNGLGQLGYGNTLAIGDTETPASAGDVPLGGRAVGVVAGGTHTCARMATGAVRCWGDGSSGQLGYGNTQLVGDDETPASVGDVPID